MNARSAPRCTARIVSNRRILGGSAPSRATSDRSTSRCRAAAPFGRSGAQTASASATRQRPRSVVSRRRRIRSSGSSSDTVHSTIASSVRCLGSEVRQPLVRSEKRSSSPSTVAARPSSAIRPAASSSARGIPSSRRAIVANARVDVSVGSITAPLIDARWTSSRTASLSRASTSSSSSGGTGSGATLTTRSSRDRTGSVVVTSSVQSGHVRTISSAREATASRTCSALSSTSSRWPVRSVARTTSTSSWPGTAVIPTAAATVGTTRSPSETGESSTRCSPSGKRAATEAAASRASLVLPTPPGPCSVIIGWAGRSSRSWASSPSRPTMLERGRGRPWSSHVARTGGKSSTIPGATIWRSSTESSKSRRRWGPRWTRRASPGGSTSQTTAAVRRTCPPWAAAATRAA